VTVSLSELTTMRLGGPTRDFAQAADTDELVELVRRADERGTPLLLVGGGSNLVVADAGWDGLTVKVATNDFRIEGTSVQADAGLDWDVLVQATLAAGLAGFEPLSGIPGTVGATPVQNVGAFGTETAQLLSSVTVYDRHTGELAEWPVERCGFGSHRQSAFKHTDRYLILRVSYRLRESDQSAPVRYPDIVARLGIEPGGTANTQDVRQAVLQARASRGSMLDPADHDTWSVGSFFLNPVLATVPPQAAESPTFADPLGSKLSAGWLIQRAGFAPGYGSEWGRGSVTLSTKHALSVTNRGDATTAEVVAFAAHIRAGVQDRFGVRLVPECHLINCSLDDPA
jgi:UDP-N-acetylmuramate dehydrogenase